jgi:hypothetical protein
MTDQLSTPESTSPEFIQARDGRDGTPALPAGGVGQLTKAIALVMKEVETVTKRGQNTFHRYRFARMEDVLGRLTPLLGKHGLAIFQDEIGRSMFDGDSVIAITYEFAVAHESGEVWPQRLRQTGVSRCRDSKGGWDDKAVNKCHTAARKYFLLSLFQIPTSEDDDADRGGSDASEPERTRPTGNEAKTWTTKFLARVRQAPTLAALDRCVETDRSLLDRLADVAPEQHKIADSAIARRRTELSPLTRPLPPTVRQQLATEGRG